MSINSIEFETTLTAMPSIAERELDLGLSFAATDAASPPFCSLASPPFCSLVSPPFCSAVSPPFCSAVSPPFCSASDSGIRTLVTVAG